MNWLARVVASTIVRRLTLLALAALLAWFGLGEARAQATNICVQGGTCNIGQAWAECEANATVVRANPEIDWAICSENDGSTEVTGAVRCDAHRAVGANANCTSWGAAASLFFYNSGCPVGTTWNETTHHCDAPNMCADAPDLGPGAVLETAAGGSKCALYQNTESSALCEYVAKVDGGSNYLKKVVIGAGTNRTVFAGGWEATGSECSGMTPEKPYDPQKMVCNNISATARECVFPNGDHCVTTNQVVQCWGPGETGHRNTADGTHGADRQQAPAPNTPPPGIENPTPNGTSNTTINNNTYNTTNYSGGGTGNGGPLQPNVGSGGNDPGAGGGDGDGDGDEGSASGGGTCEAPPSCTADPVGCAVLQQAWYLRCAETGDSGDAAPSGELGDGDDAGPAMGDVTAVSDKAILWDKITEVPELDDSGFLGAGQCPTFPTPEINGHPMEIDFSKICELLSTISHMVLALAYFMGIKILTGTK